MNSTKMSLPLATVLLLLQTTAMIGQQKMRAQWDAGQYLSNAQKTTMGYLAVWNASTTDKHVIVCGHRGAYGIETPVNNVDAGKTYYVPENTLASVLLAGNPQWSKNLNEAAEVVELDVKLSKDNHAMMVHDLTIGRVANPSFNPSSPPKGGFPGNNFVYQLPRQSMINLPTRPMLRGVNSFSYASRANMYSPWYNAGWYNITTLGAVLGSIKTNPFFNKEMIVALDIKDLATAKACVDVVRHFNAWDWVIFKMNINVVYDIAAASGQEYVRFERALGLRLGSRGDERKLLNFVPVFQTRHAAVVPLLNAYNSIINKPYFFTLEVNIKEGGINMPDESRAALPYAAMHFLAKKSAYFKMGIFNAEPDAIGIGGASSEQGYHFRADNGGCCVQLKDYLVKESENKIDAQRPSLLIPVYDTRDRRGDGYFLFGGLMNYRGGQDGYNFRWVITDALGRYQNWLEGQGLRPYSITRRGFDEGNSESADPRTSVYPELREASVPVLDYIIANEEPYSYQTPKLDRSSRFAGTGRKVIANSFRLFTIDLDSMVRSYNFANSQWEIKKGLSARDVASQYDGRAWAVGYDHSLYQYDDYKGYWFKVDSPKASKIAIGGYVDLDEAASMETIAMIGLDSLIYQYEAAESKWQKIGDIKAIEIAVDAVGEIWYIDTNHKVWRFDRESMIDMGMEGLSVTCGDDRSVVLIGKDNNIWAFNNASEQWSLVYKTKAEFTQIGIANASYAFALKPNGEIWQIKENLQSRNWSEQNGIDSSATFHQPAQQINLNNVLLSPNPAQGFANVQLPDGMQHAQVTLLNALGAVLESKSNALSYSFDLSPYPKGMYFVKVTYKGQSITKSLASL